MNTSTERSMALLGGPLAVALGFVGCALFALSFPPVPDHGYQFYVAGRVLDGARLYVDVAAAESHPPLITWIAMALEGFGRLIGVSSLTLLPFFVSLLAAGSLYMVWRTGVRSSLVLIAIVFALMPLSGPYFGQGEHLAVIMALPYLAETAASIERNSFDRATRIIVAVAAALGLALKPYFALVWIGVEVYRATQCGWRSIFRVESVIIGSIFVAYVIATALLTPDFFRILPWVLSLYPRFAPVPLRYILIDKRGLLFLLGLISVVIVRRDTEWKQLATVLGVASTAMYITVLLQGKNWGYHWYPVNALSTILCVLAVRKYAERFVFLIPAIAVGSIVLMNIQVSRITKRLAEAPGFLPEMMHVTDKYASGGSIIALSHTLAIGFPLVNLSGVKWVSPYGHLWMVPAIYQDSLGERGKFRDIERNMFDRLWNSIEQNNPNLTIVQVNLLPYFKNDPRFRQRLDRSPVIGTVGYYVIFGRPGPQ